MRDGMYKKKKRVRKERKEPHNCQEITFVPYKVPKLAGFELPRPNDTPLLSGGFF
jgi:hypothetical protein